MTEFVRPDVIGVSHAATVNPGTLVLLASSTPAHGQSDEAYRVSFEQAIHSLQGLLATGGAFAVNDAHVRQIYNERVQAAARELRNAATRGAISWKQAAEEASQLRNTIMEALRARTSPVGRARAEAMKAHGKTVNTLIAEKTIKLFGESADFNRLTAAQKNQVYAAVVESSGKANAKVNAQMANARVAGRALIFLSLAISAYTIATAEDKVAAAKKEAVVTGASIAGGIAGGAAAGLLCGPGAPVCVTIGAFVGGALAAFGVSMAW